MVDAVSSLGGVPFAMDEWGIDLCASASQKCLGSPPGLGPCAVGKRAWEAIDRNTHKCHGWYTDLKTWRKYQAEWGDWHPTPVTMPTNNVYALRASLDELLAEGIPTRLERYRKLALKLRAGLRKVGLPPFTPDDQLSSVLTAGIAPEGISSLRIVDYLLDEYGIKISPGLGALKERIFRVGHMSPVTTEADIDLVIEALAKFQVSHK
jgi:alanine-glyoxylate transaminase/serine-glyoxylate transaminase/serine-pyruvate transaminase